MLYNETVYNNKIIDKEIKIFKKSKRVQPFL